jgi:hypothetical protein
MMKLVDQCMYAWRICMVDMHRLNIDVSIGSSHQGWLLYTMQLFNQIQYVYHRIDEYIVDLSVVECDYG